MTRLGRVKSALAAMTDEELHALHAAAEESRGVAEGLFAWLEHITGWELDRREQQHYLLRFPSETIPLDAFPQALLALGTLGVRFRAKGGSAEIEELLKAAGELLQTGTPLH